MNIPTGPFKIPQKISKEQEVQSEIQEINKNKRRSKNDPNGRTYICGCSKMYLSYPALYTHIKTKHSGINPEGTNAPQYKNGRGRGRPRKIRETTAPIKERVTHPSDNIRGNPLQADEIVYARQSGFYHEQGANLLQGFPKIYRNNQEINHPLIEVVREQKTIWDQVQNGLKPLSKRNTCDWVFGKFLLEHGLVCNDELYRNLVTFICLFHQFLNDEVELYQEGKYTEIMTCEDLPQYANSFKLYLNQKGIMAEEGFLKDLNTHFFQWLYSHGFTHMCPNQVIL